MEWQELAGPQRLKDMQSTIELLIRWQKSTYQLPLLENPSAFHQEKERIAALLVDNHLGKLARKVRMLGEKEGLDSDSFLDDWAEITFFTSLWSGFEELPEGMKLNLIYQSGPNITKKHLTKEKHFKDLFLVVGQQFSEEERLIRRSVYCHARGKKKFYLLLDYSFNQQPFDRTYHTGEVYEGGAVEYPFPGSLRISPGSWKRDSNHAGLFDDMRASDMKEIIALYSSALKVNPFCEPYPVMVKLSSHCKKGEWMTTDIDQNKVKINIMDEERATVFHAASYKRQLLVFALCSRDGVLPLSYFNGEYLIEMV